MNETVATSDGLVSLPAIQEMAETYRLSAKAFAFTFRAVAMPQPHTEAEFVSCCLVAKEHGLNPLTKEIYFMRDKHGNIQAIVGVDGWIKKCNEHPQFDGLEFDPVNDANGNPVSLTIAIYRKDRSRPTKVTEYFSECVQTRKTDGPWQTHRHRMLRNRTICQGSRIAFGFAGIMDRDEFDQWQAMKDVTPKPANECQSLPSLPDLPDIPDVPDISDEQPEQIADVAGFLAKLTEDRSYCESEDDVRELAAGNEEIIARLPDDAKAKAAEILRIEE
jgi:hypothetical protein